MSNNMHCPRCGKLFYIDIQRLLTNGGSGELKSDHSISEFICSTCNYAFKMKFDQFRNALVPFFEIKSEEPPQLPSYSMAVESETMSDPISLRIKDKWQDVLEDFNNSNKHNEFIDLCHKLGRINYAQERYLYLKSALGDDEDVNHRLKQVELLVLQNQSMKDREIIENQRIPYLRRYGTIFIVGILFILIGSLLKELKIISIIGTVIVIGLLINDIKK